MEVASLKTALWRLSVTMERLRQALAEENDG
jgi:hypothetical protein